MSTPSPDTPVRLHIAFLGRPMLHSGDGTALSLKYRKGWAVLAYLACHAGRWLARDELAELLWPDLARESARTNLRQVVADLRRVLNRDEACAPLQVGTAQVRLEQVEGLQIDVAALMHAMPLAQEALVSGQLLGTFLQGISFPELEAFERWVQSVRQQLSAQVDVLVERHLAQMRERGDREAALLLARHWHTARPLEDTPVVQLMALLLEQGEGRAAQQCYDAYAAACQDELGAPPGPAVQALLPELVEWSRAHEVAPLPPLASAEMRTLAFVYAYPNDDLRSTCASWRDSFCRVIEDWEGEVLRLPGEGMMAVFGMGAQSERLAERALHAAWRVRQRIDGLRISVSCGRVQVQGTAQTLELQGAAPDYAQHMAWGAAPNTIVVCDNARQQAGTQLVFELQPERASLPTRASVRTHRLIHVVERHAQAQPCDAAVALVGRTTVVEAICAAWQQARQGEARIAILQGRPGLGKTRLAGEVARQVLADGGQVCRLSGRLEWRHQPLAPVRGLLLEWAEVAVEDSVAVQRDKVAAYLAQHHAQLGAAHFELLLSLFGLQGAAELPEREAVFMAVLALLDSVFNNGPALLIVDDLHWCDHATLALLSQLMRSLAKQPLLLVLCGRPGSCPAYPLTRTQVHDLAPLSHAAATQLVQAHDSEGCLSLAECEHIAAVSGGVPLFIGLLVRSRHEGRPTHHSINELVLAELSQLGRARAVLCAAAVWGQHFHLHQLQAVLPDSDVREGVRRALQQQLITRVDDARYVFAHALIRDVAYDSLPAAQQRQLHAACAQWLAHQHGPAQAIAEHHARAGHWQAAADKWQQAAEAALAAEFAADAQQGFEHALALLLAHSQDHARILALRMVLGRAAQMAEGFGSVRAYEQFGIAVTDLEALPEGSTAYRQQLFAALCGRYLGGGGREQGVLDGLDLAWRLVGLAESPAEHLMACYALGNSLFWRGRLHAARDWLERGVVLAAGLPPTARTRFAPDDPAITCRAFLAWTLWFLGDEQAATRLAAEGVALARRGQRSHALCFMLTFASGVNWCREDVSSVRRSSSEAQALAHQQGFPLWQSVNALFLQWVAARQGRLPDTTPLFAAVAAMQNAYDSGVTTARWIALRAVVAQGQQWAHALPMLDAAIHEAEGNETLYCLADLLWLKAECLQHTGQALAARQYRQRARSLARRQQSAGLLQRFSRQAASRLSHVDQI